MKTKTLIFFIDAVRPDYINQKDTPFMYGFAKKHTSLKLKSLLGFSSGIHPTIWNGQYQEKHGNFLVYSFNPKKADFAWIKYLQFLPAKIRQVFIAGLKAPFYWSKNKNRFPKWYKDKILPIPASIDPKQAKFFCINKETYKPFFFEILKKNKINFSSQPDHTHPIYGKGVKIVDWHLTEKEIDYYFVYETDPIGHYYGPRSKEMKEKMHNIDKKISSIYSEAKERYGNVNMFIFSDHGMVEVNKTINVKKELDKLKLKPIRDYIVFFDSTMVRLWVKNKKNKDILIKELSKINHLTYLNEELKTKYHIRFGTRKWGDLMFLADPGFRIFPDYFAPVKFNTKGMHGYWPEFENGKGVFITNTFRTEKKEMNVINLMPTILSILKLKKLTPKNIGGKSII